jgi:hypothetical protein
MSRFAEWCDLGAGKNLGASLRINVDEKIVFRYRTNRVFSALVWMALSAVVP